MTLVGSGYLSELEQSHVAHLVNHATWFVAERHRIFCFSKASQIDFGREPFLHFSNTSLTFPIRSSSFKIASLCNSFNSEVDCEIRLLFFNKWLTTSRQFPFALWFWVLSFVFPWSSLSPLFALSAPVSWCGWTHFLSLVAAAAAAAVAAIAKHS